MSIYHTRGQGFTYSKCMTSTLMAVLLFISCTKATIVVKGTSFKVTKGYKLTQGTQLKTTYSTRMSSSFCSILCRSECGSATYSRKYKTCTTFRDKFYSSTVAWSKDPDWCVLYRDEPIQYGNWTLVFRAQKEIKVPLYDVWTATGQHHDSPLLSSSLNGCYRLDNLGGCNQHFRSAILDNWKNIKQVKFSLYVNGSEVVYIVFDGTSSDRESWFQRSEIQYSSWASIKTNVHIDDFQVQGLTINNNERRFVIFGTYFGCDFDKIYFVAIDKSYDDCEDEWSMSISSYPLFMYSKLDGLARMSENPKEFSYADVMAVFVKF